MISENYMKEMSRWGLRLIMFLFLSALIAVFAAYTPSAQAQERKKEPEYSTESEEYKLTCDDKKPNGCNSVFILLSEYKKYIEQKKKREEETQNNMRKRNPNLHEFMDI